MKRIFQFLTFILIVTGISDHTGISWAAPSGAVTMDSKKKVAVYYFHFTRRCQTCLNVEKVAKESTESLFPEQIKEATIVFQSINLDEKEGEELGKKFNVGGQTLLVVCDDKRIDITDKGFLYANGNPDKLKEEIRKAVEGLLK